MRVNDEETGRLSLSKHILMRQYDRKEINKEEYDLRLEELENKIKERTEYLLKKEEEKLEEENKMVEEVKKEKVKKEKVEGNIKAGRKSDPSSYGSVIIEVLKKKGIKTLDATIDKVTELKPGRDSKKTANQIKTIIRLVKNQKPDRWKKYSWDAENYLLTEKE